MTTKKIDYLFYYNLIILLMSLLIDKFSIIENNVKDVDNSDLTSMIENYFENLLHSDEKVIHPDLISQILWFRKDVDYSNCLTKQLEQYLKQKKNLIRTNIKKGIFHINDLIKMIVSYNQKVHRFSLVCIEKDNILKLSSLQLFELILSDPSMIGLLKNQLGDIENNNKKDFIEIFKVMKYISDNNPQLKAYQWFLLLVSSSLKEVADEINNKTYPIPENQQSLVILTMILKFCEKINDYYSFSKNDISNILVGSVSVLCELLIKFFEFSSIKQITAIFKNNYKVISGLVYTPNLNYNEVLFKDFITSQFIKYMNDKLNKEMIYDFNMIYNFCECFKLFEPFLINNNKDVINKRISDLFSDDKIQNLLIDNIHNCILSNNSDEEKLKFKNILYFCNTIREKDKFIDTYNRKLITRLLQNNSLEQIEIEKKYYDVMKEKFGIRILYRTNKIIFNAEQSFCDLNNFNQLDCLKKYSDKLKIMTGSFQNWDINQNEGVVEIDNLTVNSELNLLFSNYDLFYKKRYESKRKLLWYPHFGEIEFTFNEMDYKMLPIQFMILELIQSQNLEKENVLNVKFLENYSQEFKKSLVGSLIEGGIVKEEQNKLIINNISNTRDYIELFFNTTDYSYTWEEKRKEAFSLTREEIISANINHYVKVEPILKNRLFDLINKNLNIFELDKDLFEKVLLQMAEKDYISIKDDLIEKLFY
jgi:hypothetical protein